MKNIKIATLLLTLIFLNTEKIIAQKYFKVLDATSVSWTGGMPQTGNGTTYTVEALLTTSDKISFKDFWVDSTYGLPEVSSLTYSDGRAFKNGDTVLIKYTIHHYPPNSPMAGMSNPFIKPVPIYYRGKALLGFTAGDIKKYRAIKTFRELQHQNYQ